MHTHDVRAAARALGGDISGRDRVVCPGPGHSHEDRSLSVKFDPSAPDGFVVHSFANDDPIRCKDHVREKLRLEPFKLNGKVHHLNRATGDRVVATYDYTDQDGTLLYQVLRYEPKGFRQRRPDGAGGWMWKRGERTVLYRWPKLAKYPDATVFVTEGEKDADRVADLGACATTISGGAKWSEENAAALAGRDCLILEDNDDEGRKKALEAAQALHGHAKSVRIVRLPGLAERGDASDWLNADPKRDLEALTEMAFAAPLWAPEQPSRLAVSSAEFVAGFVPPDYLIEGLLQRRFLYSMTAATGTGKTAIALLLAAYVSRGMKLGRLEIAPGSVLYFAGENPDDIRMRWLAMTQQLGLTPEDTDNVYFVPGVFKFSEIGQRIRDEMATRELALVVVDTSAAYFETDDENSNTQVGAHARRLRQLVQLEGGPTVLVCCHPIKHAGDDNLLPRGGGAFLAEVDGNLTCKKDDSAVELHWQGKFRGPDFAPIAFLLRTVTHERLKDTKGRLIPTVVAQVLSEEGLRDLTARTRNDEDAVLISIGDNPRSAQRDRATDLGWLMKNGDPYQMRVRRAETALEKGKLIVKVRNGWELTERGKKELQRIKKGDVSTPPLKQPEN